MANTAPSDAVPAVVLVAEDAAHVTRLSQLLDERLGGAVVVVTTLPDALVTLATQRVDCVMVDLDLVQSTDVASLAGAVSGAVPIVALSAHADVDVAEAAVAAGADDVVDYGVADDALARCVRVCIARAARRSPFSNEAPGARGVLHDPLTGLPKALVFTDRVQHAITRMARTMSLAAVLSVHLDGIEDAAHAHGPQAVDDVLQVIAHRLTSTMRDSDTVARVGDDAFLMLCEDLGSADDALVVAERVRLAISRPIELDTGLVEVVPRVGMATADRSTDAQALLQRADFAAHATGNLPPATSPAWTSPPGPANPGPRMLQEALERALDVDAFSLAYQPVTDLPSGRLVAVEALLRWDDGERMRDPHEFLPVAEASGLIVPIGGWVLREACSTLAEWRRRGEVTSDVVVSVNLAARQLSDERLLTDVVDALDGAGLPPENLAVEITETTLIGDPETAATTVGRLKDLGVAVWLDDFGTGYSSLSYLDQYPVDAIKLDRSFLRKLGDRRGRALLITVSDLAARLGIAAIAEGVETEEQREVVARLGFTAAQGFYLGHPQLAVDLLQAT